MVRKSQGRQDWNDDLEQERRLQELRNSRRKRVRREIQPMDDYDEFDDWETGGYQKTRSRNMRRPRD